MAVSFVRNGQIVSVSDVEPLPVVARIYTADVLYENRITISSTDYIALDGSQDPEQPMLVNCAHYIYLIWQFYVGNVGAQLRALARATGSDGWPLGPGWATLYSSEVLPGHGAARIPSGQYGHYDQYRFEARSSNGSEITIVSKIIGVR